MLKILNPVIHGALDYALALAFLFAPRVLGFESNAASTIAQIVGVTYIGASLLTRYPLGLIKMIPFPLHGFIESVMALSWIAAPWLLGFSADAAARNFFLLAGVGLLGVVALTDYQRSGIHRYAGSERRHHLTDRRQRYLDVRSERRAGPRDRRAYAARA